MLSYDELLFQKVFKSFLNFESVLLWYLNIVV